jgi:hypothetical protein
MLFKKNEPFFLGVSFIWLLICVVTIIETFTLADIEITDNILIIKNKIKIKKIDLSTLHIYEITIRRHPLFFMETTAGNFNINYTKYNYQQILELSKRIHFKGIELLKNEVDKNIILTFIS